MEKPRKKEQKKGKTAKMLALGAELIVGSAAVNAARTYEPSHTERVERDPKFADFRRTEDVLDHRGESPEAAAFAQRNAFLEPELPINDDALNSSLAADAGIHDIGRTPAEVLRKRKAQAAVLAKKAHEAWEREKARKHDKRRR